MTNPVTHLLWGYTISRNISKKKDYIIFGIIMSAVLDLDAISFFGVKHHGIVHTPVFIIAICSIIFLCSFSKTLFIISIVNLFFHLILDTFGTSVPIMWFYPVSDFSYAIGEGLSLFHLIIIKIIWFTIPTIYLTYLYLNKKEDPFELIQYIEEKIGKSMTYILLTIIVMIITYILLTQYIMRLLS